MVAMQRLFRLMPPVHFRGSALPRGHFQSVTPP
jgi:hypothetical protein